MQFRFRRVDWEFTTPFRVAHRTRTHAQTVQIELTDGRCVGRAEAQGVSYHGETVETVLDQLSEVAGGWCEDTRREDLPGLLPAGGARNAIDCALWDLESKQRGRRAWDIAGLAQIRQLSTAFTLAVDTPEAMAHAATDYAQYPILKLKLTGDVSDFARAAAVRESRPDATLIVDANQSWNEEQLRNLTPRFAELKITLIEQPLPTDRDAILLEFVSPVPLCADESCQTADSLDAIVGKYQFVNIKLDKTGGLTEALHLAYAAKAAGLQLMVGCMAGSSLAMAPAFIVGQLCALVDLDGPLLAKADMPHAICYEANRMSPPDVKLWG